MREIIKTISRRGESIYEEKKSSFIGIAVPISKEQEALDFIKNVRSEYKKAKHYVYAYTVYEGDTLICRYSDDNEPQGTGGVPVLSVLEGGEIQNAAIVVVRYFGGILLGASGLTRAYRKAASDAAAQAGTVIKALYDDVSVMLDYQSYNAVKRVISAGFPDIAEKVRFRLAGEDFSDKIVIHLHTACADTSDICEAVRESSLGRAVIHIDEKKGSFEI